jgi:hypothetical protein
MDLYFIPQIAKSYDLYPTINRMMLYIKFNFFLQKFHNFMRLLVLLKPSV